MQNGVWNCPFEASSICSGINASRETMRRRCASDSDLCNGKGSWGSQSGRRAIRKHERKGSSRRSTRSQEARSETRRDLRSSNTLTMVEFANSIKNVISPLLMETLGRISPLIHRHVRWGATAYLHTITDQPISSYSNSTSVESWMSINLVTTLGALSKSAC